MHHGPAAGGARHSGATNAGPSSGGHVGNAAGNHGNHAGNLAGHNGNHAGNLNGHNGNRAGDPAGRNGLHAGNPAGHIGMHGGNPAGLNGNHGGNLAGHTGNRPGDAFGPNGANPRNNHWNNHFNGGMFAGGWFNNHLPAQGWWHPGFAWANQPWGYWWALPTWGGLTSWFGNSGWTDPAYYDYGPGGNLAFQGEQVYWNGEDIGTMEQFAQSAAVLANVAPPSDDAVAENAEWLPLGVFALSTGQQDTDPSRVLQLAVNKEGIISGTLYDAATDRAEIVQGQVDNQTQRVAFRIGDNQNLVAETGAYNLTQNETPLMMHFGQNRLEQYRLVRLDPPADDQARRGQ